MPLERKRSVFGGVPQSEVGRRHPGEPLSRTRPPARASLARSPIDLAAAPSAQPSPDSLGRRRPARVNASRGSSSTRTTIADVHVAENRSMGDWTNCILDGDPDSTPVNCPIT